MIVGWFEVLVYHSDRPESWMCTLEGILSMSNRKWTQVLMLNSLRNHVARYDEWKTGFKTGYGNVDMKRAEDDWVADNKVWPTNQAWRLRGELQL